MFGKEKKRGVVQKRWRGFRESRKTWIWLFSILLLYLLGRLLSPLVFAEFMEAGMMTSFSSRRCSVFLTRRVELNDYRVGTEKTPFLEGGDFRIRYGLWQWLFHGPRIRELDVDGLLVRPQNIPEGLLDEDALDRNFLRKILVELLVPDKDDEDIPSPHKLQNMRIRNVGFLWESGEDWRFSLAGIEAELPAVRNGGSCRVPFKARVENSFGHGFHIEEARFEGVVELSFDVEMKLASCKLESQLRIVSGGFREVDLSGAVVRVDLDEKRVVRVGYDFRLALSGSEGLAGEIVVDGLIAKKGIGSQLRELRVQADQWVSLLARGCGGEVQPKAKFRLEGRGKLGRDGVEATANVKFSDCDLRPFAVVLQQRDEKKKKKRETSREKEASGRKTDDGEETLEGIDWAKSLVHFQLDCQRLSLHELTGGVQAKLSLANGRLKLDDCLSEFASGEVPEKRSGCLRATGEYALADGTFFAGISGDGIPIGPFSRSVLPPEEGVVSGMVESLELKVAGQGDELRLLTAELHAQGRDLCLRGMEFQREWAEEWRVPLLGVFEFSSGRLHGEYSGETLRLLAADFAGPKGTLGITGELDGMGKGTMLLDIGAGQELAKQLSRSPQTALVMPFAYPQNGLMRLPVPLPWRAKRRGKFRFDTAALFKSLQQVDMKKISQLRLEAMKSKGNK